MFSFGRRTSPVADEGCMTLPVDEDAITTSTSTSSLPLLCPTATGTLVVLVDTAPSTPTATTTTTATTSSSSSDAPCVSGWMLKLCKRSAGPGRSAWRRRFFVLRAGSLGYHASAAAKDAFKVYVNMSSDVEIETPRDEESGLSLLTFKRSGVVVGIVACTSAAEQTRWLAALLAARGLRSVGKETSSSSVSSGSSSVCSNGSNGVSGTGPTAASKIKLGVAGMAAASKVGQRVLRKQMGPASARMLELLEALAACETAPAPVAAAPAARKAFGAASIAALFSHTSSTTSSSTAAAPSSSFDPLPLVMEMCAKLAVVQHECIVAPTMLYALAEAVFVVAEELLGLCWMLLRRTSSQPQEALHHQAQHQAQPLPLQGYLQALAALQAQFRRICDEAQLSFKRFLPIFKWFADPARLHRLLTADSHRPVLTSLHANLQELLLDA
eukprot:m.107729 g.107729  ORF g.107729 m.107729 type:complete len:442 (+) comp15849_c0_seq2:178-1503(+)